VSFHPPSENDTILSPVDATNQNLQKNADIKSSSHGSVVSLHSPSENDMILSPVDATNERSQNG
jgi:hypothetical protein